MLWLLVTATRAQAGTLERAYDALQRYDYFKAKKLFTM